MVAIMAPATLTLPLPYPKYPHNLQQKTHATHFIAYPKRKKSPFFATQCTSLKDSPSFPDWKTDNRHTRQHYVSLLQDCIKTRSLTYGRQLHARVLICGLQQDVFVTSKIINMYVLCGLLTEAVKVFESVDISHRDIYLWTALINGYVKFEQFDEAIELYCRMQRDGVNVQSNHYTFSCLLKACAGLHALQLGRQVHLNIIRSGYEWDAFLSSALVEMYTKCSSMEDARKVLNEMSGTNFAGWNSMIAGYIQKECWKEALDLFRDMTGRGLKPNSITIFSVLPACSEVEKCREVHAYFLRNGFQESVDVATALLDAYAKCGRMSDARRLFARMPDRDAVTWTAMISGYIQKGDHHMALRIFYKMQAKGVKPDEVTISNVMRACALVARQASRKGKSYRIK